MKRNIVYCCLALMIIFCISVYNKPELFEPGISEPLKRKVLPRQYDSRVENRVSLIKDQGDLGTCWAFAACMAIESSLLPEEVFDFSEDHMSANNSFALSQDEGGEYTISMAYLLAWQGPVLESEDPYGDGYSPKGLKAVKHVQEIQILEEKKYNKIKRAIIQYGSVQSSLYTAIESDQSQSPYYNQEAYSYLYQGDLVPNHDIVIIGWDDDYPKERFNGVAQHNGAFLCITSWGKDFGDNGAFYVSYEDSNIGKQNVIYTSVNDITNYDRIYQNDLCGWEGQSGYGEDTAYFANVYRSRSAEELMAVGFYATKPNTEYEVYVSSGVSDNYDISKRVLAAQGSFENSGYYTVKMDSPILLEEEERFAVIVKIRSPGAVHPIAIEYPGDFEDRIDVNDGKSYISRDGVTWESTKENYQCDVCLKAYTILR